MDDEHEISEFPEKDWKTIYDGAHKRYSRYLQRREMCALMNRIVNTYQPDGEDIPWQIAALSIPGFQDAFSGFLHRLTHFAFEIGRQYEIDSRNFSAEERDARRLEVETKENNNGTSTMTLPELLLVGECCSGVWGGGCYWRV